MDPLIENLKSTTFFGKCLEPLDPLLVELREWSRIAEELTRLQTASPHAPVAPLPTPAPLDTREVDVSALA